MLRPISIALLLIVACADHDGGVEPPVTIAPEGQLHERLVPGFDDLATCLDESDSLFNCTQRVGLCPNGRIEMVVTDIVNVGTFEIRDGELIAAFDAADVPDRIVFSIGAELALVSDAFGERPFELVPEPEYPVYCGE